MKRKTVLNLVSVIGLLGVASGLPGCASTPVSAQAMAPAQAGPARTAGHPNVILFVVDDMGWEDVGFNGSRYYKTPEIDAMAANSVVFSDAYTNAPNCAPSRAAIFSGQWATRTGVYTVGSTTRGPKTEMKLIPPKNTEELAGSFVTMTETFKANGYTTGHFGKWHMGESEGALPQAQGFDFSTLSTKVKGGGGDAGKYFSPFKGVQGLENEPAGSYLTDSLTKAAVRFVADNKAKPFFMYFPHFAVHTPLQAKKGTTGEWDAIPQDKRQGLPVYASMVKSVDESLGTLVDALEKQGVADNTIIIFTSDNGGYIGSTYAPSLRGAKGMLYEGGIRVPTFIHVPGGVHGKKVGTPMQLFDLYPTLVDLAGLKLPEGAKLDGHSVAHSAKTGETTKSAAPLIWFYPVYLPGDTPFPGSKVPAPGLFRTRPVAAIRDGDWKLVQYYENQNYELYNLANDMAETRDLSQTNPEVAARLLGQLRAWEVATKAKVPTQLNPEYNPAKPGDAAKGGKKAKEKEAKATKKAAKKTGGGKAH